MQYEQNKLLYFFIYQHSAYIICSFLWPRWPNVCKCTHMFWGDISLPQYSAFSTSIINSAALTASSKVTCRNSLLPGLHSWHSFEKLGWDSQRYTASPCPEDRGLITFWGTLSTYSAIVSRSCCLLYRTIKCGIFAQWDIVDTTHVFVHFYVPGVNHSFCFVTWRSLYALTIKTDNKQTHQIP